MPRIKEVLRLNQLRGLSDAAAARAARVARSAVMESNIRQIPNCFEAKIAPLTGPDNDKSRPGLQRAIKPWRPHEPALLQVLDEQAQP
jgi:hypothetical protein